MSEKLQLLPRYVVSTVRTQHIRIAQNYVLGYLERCTCRFGSAVQVTTCSVIR